MTSDMEELNQNQKDPGSVIKSIMVEQEEKAREALDPLMVVTNAVNSLKEREREVLLNRFGLADGNKMTLEAVGSKFGVTRERVRQIEATAVSKLIQKPTKELIKLLKLVNGYVAEMGGVAALEGLAGYFKIEADQRREAELNALRLTLTLDGNVMSLPKADLLKIGWIKRGLPVKTIETVLSAVGQILTTAGKPLSEEALWEQFSGTAAFTGSKPAVTPMMLKGILQVGSKLAQTSEDKWGLTTWPLVVPKRIRDKVYLVLQRATKPMHFREIAEAINQNYPGKTVLSRTVHNELIGDPRFVLVGRGIYGLKEWGYQPGVVADVIKRVLKEAGRPLQAEEIIEAVLKDRQVKRNTVIANLQNKGLFKKVAKGMYTLTEEQK